jgi:hypothetical protein
MAINPSWNDFLFSFPLSGITTATAFLSGARAQHFFNGGYSLPDNSLGDPRDASGNIVTTTDANGNLVGVVFNGRPGQAAYSYTDPSGNTVNVAAVGDPTRMYMAVRVPVTQAQLTAILTRLGRNLALYGIAVTDPTLSAQLLGVWS